LVFVILLFVLRRLEASTACGGTLQAGVYGAGGIKSPNSPGKYPNNSNCTWVINAPDNRVVTMTWRSFHVEGYGSCAYDYVQTAGSLDTINEAKKYCGSSKPPDVTSSGSTLVVHFKSDPFYGYSGFTAVYASRAMCPDVPEIPLNGPNTTDMCPDVPIPDNGATTWGDNSAGANRSFICNPGYRLLGSDVTVCQSDHTWSHDAPKCSSSRCELLRIKGVEPYATTGDGVNLLMFAAWNDLKRNLSNIGSSQSEVTEALLGCYREDGKIEEMVTARHNFKGGATALCVATYGADLETVRLLVAAGSDVSASCEGQRSPLMEAAHWNKPLEMVELLMAMGAYPYQKDINGNGLKFWAKRASVEVRAFLRRAVPKSSHCDWLRSKGVEPYATFPGNLNHLMVAGFSKFENNLSNIGSSPSEVTEQLLRCYREDGTIGDMVTAVNAYGHGTTALCVATYGADLATVRLLVAAGSDVNYNCQDNRSPLFEAVKWHKPLEMVQLLIAMGANTNHKDVSNNGLAHFAGMGRTDVRSYLRDRGLIA